MNKLLAGLVLALAVGLLSYIAAYSLLLQPRGLDVIWGEPGYRWNSPGVKTFFEPIHQVDRKLRPERWRIAPPTFLSPSDPRFAPAESS